MSNQKMIRRMISIFFLALSLTACSQMRVVRQGTGEEAIRLLTDRMPVLLTSRTVEHAIGGDQTINGMTVRITQVSLSQSTIAIGVITHNNSGKKFMIAAPSLTDATGAALKFKFSTGWSGAPDDIEFSLPPGEQVDMVFFDEPNNLKVNLPFTGTFLISYHEVDLWHEITKLGQPIEVGPFQFEVAIPNQ